MLLLIRISTLLILFVNTLDLAAQVPGFQGKRFFVEIGISAFPNLAFPTAQNKGGQSFPFNAHTGHFTLKDRYDFSFYYVSGRRSAVKAGYNYQVSGINSLEQTDGLNGGYDLHNLFYQLHMHDLNLGVNLYKDKAKNLSPIGMFIDFGIRLVFVNGVLRDQRVEYYDNRQDHKPYPDQLNPLTEPSLLCMFGLSGQWGYRTVIANRLTLSIGFECSIFPQYVLAQIGNVFRSSTSDKINLYQQLAIQNVQDRYLLSLHLGVGVLLF
jgi:hypothetical protein